MEWLLLFVLIMPIIFLAFDVFVAAGSIMVFKNVIAMHPRLSIRFNDDGSEHILCRWAEIKYDNGDHFSAEHKASDDVITDFKPTEKDIDKDGKIWKIEPNDHGHYLKVSIGNKFWIIEKWKFAEKSTEDKVLYRYARTMDKVLTVKVNYTS
jgi:hypothetical protein